MPGNNPGMLLNADLYRADSVVFDLEDAVSVYEKDAARDLVRNALKYNEYRCEVGVRVNHISTPFGYDDLEAMMSVKPDFLRLPKSEEAEDIQRVDEIVTKAEARYGYEPGSVKFVLTIETALGIRNSYELAKASRRVVAMGIGAEDFAADMQANRSRDGKEILFAKSQLLLSARAAKIQALDNVFADVKDEEAFCAETQLGKDLGFDGKSVIHPSQIPLVHGIYAPSDAELEKSRRILAAYEDALANNSGVIALDGKMIDGPIVKRAERALAYAAAIGGQQGGRA